MTDHIWSMEVRTRVMRTMVWPRRKRSWRRFVSLHGEGIGTLGTV